MGQTGKETSAAAQSSMLASDMKDGRHEIRKRSMICIYEKQQTAAGADTQNDGEEFSKTYSSEEDRRRCAGQNTEERYLNADPGQETSQQKKDGFFWQGSFYHECQTKQQQSDHSQNVRPRTTIAETDPVTEFQQSDERHSLANGFCKPTFPGYQPNQK